MKQLKINYVKMTNEGAKFEKVITIGDSYFIRAYEVYKGAEFKDGEVIDNIIKVALDGTRGLEQLKNGIDYEDKHYVEIVTTPGGQKQEFTDADGSYKCESFFIAEDEIKFKEELKESISAGKLNTLKDKEISINKMVSSRLALATSSIKGAIDIDVDRVCVVDEYTYKYVNNYSWFNQDNELEQGQREVEFTFSDGQGLMSNAYADKIKEGLGLGYKVDFAVCRIYGGLATKGVLLRFNFADYFKSKGFNTIKDIYGAEWNVEDIDIIVNPSMVKWFGLHNNIKDVVDYYNNNNKYTSINSKLYITKTNHAPNEVKSQIQLNYQALVNTNISATELIQLAEKEIEQFKNVIKFNNINYLKLALGNIEKEDEDTNTDLVATLIDKFGEEALNFSYIRRTVKRVIEKQIKQLSGGKIYVDGGYRIACVDPILFCNKIIGITTEEELSVGEFINGNIDGKRVAYRSPIAYFDEIHQANLTTREWAKDYSEECFFINGKDDFLFRSSGADLDGDGFAIIDNNILYNSVIKCNAPFINLEDGKVVKMAYTEGNYCQAIWLSCGNLIGKIANDNCKLSVECASYSTIVKDGKVALYRDVKSAWRKANGLENPYNKNEEKDEYKAFERKVTDEFMSFIENSGYKWAEDFTEEERKKFRSRLFIKNQRSFFKILLASQQTIDMPKTLMGISEELNKDLKEISKGLYKPKFLLSLDKATEEQCVKYGSNNPLDEFNYYVYKQLLKPLYDGIRTDGKDPNKAIYGLLGDVDNGNYNKELYKIYKENNSINRKETDYNVLVTLDSITFLKMLNLNISVDDIATTAWESKFSMRFIFQFFRVILADRLNKMESKTDKLIEVSNGDIEWKNKKYEVIERQENMEIKDVMQDFIKKGIVQKVRVYNADGINFSGLNKTVTVKDGKIDGIGTLIKTKYNKEILEDGEYKVANYTEVDKSGIRATLYIAI